MGAQHQAAISIMGVWLGTILEISYLGDIHVPFMEYLPRCDKPRDRSWLLLDRCFFLML